jgi:hypothetical protein
MSLNFIQNTTYMTFSSITRCETLKIEMRLFTTELNRFNMEIKTNHYITGNIYNY